MHNLENNVNSFVFTSEDDINKFLTHLSGLKEQGNTLGSIDEALFHSLIGAIHFCIQKFPSATFWEDDFMMSSCRRFERSFAKFENDLEKKKLSILERKDIIFQFFEKSWILLTAIRSFSTYYLCNNVILRFTERNAIVSQFVNSITNIQRLLRPFGFKSTFPDMQESEDQNLAKEEVNEEEEERIVKLQNFFNKYISRYHNGQLRLVEKKWPSVQLKEEDRVKAKKVIVCMAKAIVNSLPGTTSAVLAAVLHIFLVQIGFKFHIAKSTCSGIVRHFFIDKLSSKAERDIDIRYPCLGFNPHFGNVENGLLKLITFYKIFVQQCREKRVNQRFWMDLFRKCMVNLHEVNILHFQEKIVKVLNHFKSFTSDVMLLLCEKPDPFIIDGDAVFDFNEMPRLTVHTQSSKEESLEDKKHKIKDISADELPQKKQCVKAEKLIKRWDCIQFGGKYRSIHLLIFAAVNTFLRERPEGLWGFWNRLYRLFKKIGLYPPKSKRLSQIASAFKKLKKHEFSVTLTPGSIIYEYLNPETNPYSQKFNPVCLSGIESWWNRFQEENISISYLWSAKGGEFKVFENIHHTLFEKNSIVYYRLEFISKDGV
ncbi:hypothetical protein PCE1_001667 [Barthelona sp. PCE]